MSNGIAISVMVICENQDSALKVSEVLQRAAIGLALEGLSTSMSFTNLIDDNESENHNN